MSGSTTELNLKTAVDSDDTADYLTLSLADSLRTVDALFSNSSGHNHGGLHQGGLITTVPASAIADGSITSAKIADATIQTADIADNQISMAKLQVGAAASLIGNGSVNSTFSTSTVGSWIETNVTVTCTSLGLLCRIDLQCMIQHSAADSLIYMAYGVDGTPVQALAAQYLPAANRGMMFNAFVYYTPAAGSHRFGLFINNAATGTLSLVSAVPSIIAVHEFRR